MSKKSGLGDSPLFLTSPDSVRSDEVTIQNEEQQKSQNAKQQKNDTPVSSQTEERSGVHPFERSSVQMNERSNVQDYRVTKRHSYDFFVDQIHSIDDEVVRRNRQTRRSVTKGEVIREIVDFYFSKKRK